MIRPLRHSALLLVHIWWPLLLGWSVALVVRRATARPWDPAGLAVLLLGICAAYSLDRVLDAPRGLAPWVRTTLIGATAGSTLVIGLLLPALPLETAAIVPLVGAVAVLYRMAKRIPLAKTILVPVLWTWSAIALPFNDGSWLGWHWVRQPVAIPIGLLMAAGCLLCDLKDEASDRDAGIPSLPVVAGPTAATAIAVGLALAAGSVAWVEGRPGMALSAAALGAASVWPSLLATDIVGPLVVDAILTAPGLLILTRMI